MTSFLNIKNSKLLTLFAFVLISTSVHSQTQQEVKEHKKDSVCLDTMKNCSDTINLRSNRFNQLLPLNKAKNNKRLSKDFKLPKFNPYKKKFSELQILRDVGSHISR